MKKQAVSSPSRTKGNDKIFDRIIAFCVTALFFGLPLFFLNVTSQGIIFEKLYYFYFWTFVALIVWAAKGVFCGGITIRRTPLDIPLLVLWVVFLLATLFSADRFHSLFGAFGDPSRGFIGVTVMILAYYVIVSNITKEYLKWVFWATIIASGFVSFWAFLSVIGALQLPDAVLNFLRWGVGSLSVLVVFLAALTPLYITGLYLAAQKWKDGVAPKVKSIVMGLLILINFVVFFRLFTVISFAEWIIIAIAMAFFLILLLGRVVRAPSYIVIVAALSFFALIAFVFIDQSGSKNAVPFGEHKVAWAVAKNVMKEDPLFGVGPATYGYIFSKNLPAQIGESAVPSFRASNAPGLIMYSLPTIGIIGAFTLVVFLVLYIAATVYILTRRKNADMLFSLGVTTTSLILLMTVFLARADGALFLLSIIFVAYSFSVLREESNLNHKEFSLSFAASPTNALLFAFLYILLATTILFGVVSLGKMYAADVHAGNALKAMQRGDLERTFDEIGRATQLNPNEAQYWAERAKIALTRANVEAAKPIEAENDADKRNEGAIRANLEVAVGAAQKARELGKNDVSVQEAVGAIYEGGGRYAEDPIGNARSAYESARELEPRNPLYDLRLGALKLLEVQMEETTEENVEQKKQLVEEAKTLFEQSRDKNPSFAPAYYQLSIVHEALGNIDDAIANIYVSYRIIPNDVNYTYNLARLLQTRDGEGDAEDAEILLKQILGQNDKEVTALLNLGLLYEKQNKRDEAVAEYKKILVIIPAESEEPRKRIQDLIDTVERGGSNITGGQQQEQQEGDQEGEDDQEGEGDQVDQEGEENLDENTGDEDVVIDEEITQ